VKLLVANNAAPFVRGGAELLADRLIGELRAAGHEAELLRLPLGTTPETVLDGVITAATLEAVNVDRIIALKFPAYLLPHDDVVIWLVHQFRQVYDLGPEQGGWPAPELRRIVRAADDAAFRRARRLYAISPVVAERLRRYNGVNADVLLTPPHTELAYRCEQSRGFILALGRISDGKRQLLAARAMAHARPGTRLVIAGAPDSTEALARLEAAVADEGVGDLIEIVPRFVSDEEKLDLLARCAASVYLPIDEDSYGYVCYEAAMSSKPTITATDSGGTHTLVEDGRTGLIVDPDPRSVGAAFDRIAREPGEAARMGRAARELAGRLDLSWTRVVRELTR
jgi:glycosyltransferase involved in cell wall biosynthesis